MLERVEKQLIKWINLDADAIFLDILSNREFQQFMIELNTKGQPTSQLFEQGVDSLSVSLDPDGYALNTIFGVKGQYKGKKEKGQRFDHITLEDTGQFYGTFKIEFGGSSFLFKITANPNRNNTNLFDDFGENIVGWTEENLQLIIDEFKPRIKKAIERQQAA